MTDLAAGMARRGLLHPITLRRTPHGIELVAGRHRLEAARLLRWTSIDATFITADDQEAATVRLGENLHRATLSPVEEATQLAELVENHPAGAEGVAHDINRSLDWILDRLELCQYPDSVLALIHNKQLSLTTAKILMRIPDVGLRDLRIRDAAEHGCSARTASAWLQSAIACAQPQEPPANFSTDGPVQAIETTMKLNCFTCETSHDITDTHPVRICSSCLQEIQTMKKQGPQPTANRPPTP